MKSKMRDVVVVGVCEEERMTKRVILGDLFAILFPPREKTRNVFFSPVWERFSTMQCIRSP
jgi:hypothetical protein